MSLLQLLTPLIRNSMHAQVVRDGRITRVFFRKYCVEEKITRSESNKSFRIPTSQAMTMLDIGSRSIFTEEHDIFRTSARKYFQEMSQYQKEWEVAGQISKDAWLRAGELGLIGTDYPTEYHGLGGNWRDAVIVFEEVVWAPIFNPSLGVSSALVMPYFVKFGSREQIDKFMPDLVAGRKVGAIAMTESGAGSDLQGIKTKAVRDGSDWILNGSKTYISNASVADVVIVVAVTKPDAKSIAHGISLFLVESDMPGFQRTKPLQMMGLKGQGTGELFFDNVRLPSTAVLGKENQGFYYLMENLVKERIACGVYSLAHCEWMFEETRKYVLQRKAFGSTISQFQTVQHKMAEMKTDICVARAFLDQCILLYEEEKLDQAMASMAKYWASDLENKVAYDCVQLHGGAGYMSEFPISKSYTNARVTPIYAGTNEIMKELIARQIVADKRLH